jgi:hypothetical protein
LKTLDILLEDIEKYIMGVVGVRVENILYLYIFLNQGSLVSIGKTLGDVGKAPQHLLLR